MTKEIIIMPVMLLPRLGLRLIWRKKRGGADLCVLI
jgi:hypothetical protein